MRKCGALIIMLLVTGCFALTPYSLNRVDIGMSEEEVRSIMGRPYTTKALNKSKLLSYYLHHDVVDLFFTKKFPYIGIYPFIRTGHEYWIILDDNQVTSFGRKEEFDKRIIKLWKLNNNRLAEKNELTIDVEGVVEELN